MRTKLSAELFVLGIMLAFVQPSAVNAEDRPDVIQLGSRRELFVDRFLIERLENCRLVLHEPRDEGVVLKFDRPWEGPFCGYCTVIDDGEKYRLYYRGLPTAGADGGPDETTCYAESTDGIHWQKPALGIFEVAGTRQNNVVLANATPVSHNFSPFLDTRPGVPAAEKFKALGGTQKSGLTAYVSADGIHWRKLTEKPVFTKGVFDSQNVAFWSQSEQCYVCYFRTWTGGNYSGYRTVGRTTSKDFLHWTEPVEMSFGNTPREHIYTNQTHPYFRAPHIYVALGARFMPGRQVLTKEQAASLRVDARYFSDCSDIVLMSSRGGAVFDRTFMESFLRPGVGLRNWVSRSNYAALGIVQTGPAEMSFYVNQDYAQPTAHLRRYSLRLDGFASVCAPYEGGEFVTKSFTFTGKRLLLNFATSAAGSIQVEIQDSNGQPLHSYSLKESVMLIGNEIERAVSWQHGEDVAPLAGKPIRLRFVMKDANLYSLRFE